MILDRILDIFWGNPNKETQNPESEAKLGKTR